MNTERTWAIVAGGGTAGHLLPGLAVARALVERGHDPSTIHFVGSDRGVEASLVPAAGFTVDELPGRGIQRRLTLANITAAFGLITGVFRAMNIVRRRRPSIVIALGGHASVACGLAAFVFRVPVVVLEQNARAGAANRLLGRFARAAAVSFPGTDLPRATVTGNPLRPEIRHAAETNDEQHRLAARAELALPAHRTVVAVATGSLGSRRVNTAMRGLVERWRGRSDVAVRHVIGRRDYTEFASLPDTGELVYQVVAYEDRVDLLLAAADVAVTRAGGSVAELAAMGVPAILVPLPIATRDHQTANAQVLVAAGGAVLIPDDQLDTDRLERELDVLLRDRQRLQAMSAAMRASAHLDAADRVALLVEENARG